MQENKQENKQGTTGRRSGKLVAVGVPLMLVLATLAVAPVGAGHVPDPDAHLVQLQRNLDLAGVLMETDDPIEAAKSATAWQAATLGVALESVPAPRHDAPSAAVLALAKRHGVTPSAEQMGQVMALDALPAAQADALIGVVDAFLALEDATRIAYQDADLGALLALADSDAEGAAGGATALVDVGVQVGLILGTRNDFLDATVSFQEAFEGIASSSASSTEPGISLCPALALDLDGIATTYNDNCALVLDVGGHDTYLNNAGGSKLVGAPGDCGLPPSKAGATAALVDLTGDDQYMSGGTCGHNGGGNGGVGFILDQSGSDSYTAGRAGTNGGGNGGVGFLLDQSGSDTYTAGRAGTTAAAASASVSSWTNPAVTPIPQRTWVRTAEATLALAFFGTKLVTTLTLQRAWVRTAVDTSVASDSSWTHPAATPTLETTTVRTAAAGLASASFWTRLAMISTTSRARAAPTATVPLAAASSWTLPAGTDTKLVAVPSL